MSETRMERMRREFERVLEADEASQEAVLLEIRREEGDAFADELAELLEALERSDDRFEMDASAAVRLVEEVPSQEPGSTTRLGRFEVRRRLGTGGMGTTWLGYDPELDREVALKVLRTGMLLEDGGRRELLREARAVSRLDHPGIATVYDVGESEDGRLFMAMAYVPGETLAARLARGRMTREEALDVAAQVADALAAAHEAGVVHRDVKPANIMLTPEGSVRVLDFGIAGRVDVTRESGAPARSGTPAYMSPEQARGEVVDGRSDVWSLGVVLYEMLTGERPPAGGSTSSDRPRLPARLPWGVRRVLARCLTRDPGGRYADAGSLARALERAKVPILRRVSVALVLAAALVTVIPLLQGEGRVEGEVLAVLPPTPVGRNPQLGELAQELAVTMAMNLDGIGTLRTVDPLVLLGRRELRDPEETVEERIRVARDLGATAVITGTLVDQGDQVMAEIRVTGDPGSPALFSRTVSVPAGDLVSLSDSLSWSVIREFWERGDPPSPSITGLSTTSFQSLEAFLDGERAIIEGRMYDAIDHFDRAVVLDSTFTLAHWRRWWSRSWWSEPVPQSTREHVLANLGRLPPRDSTFAAAYAEPDPYDQLRALEAMAAEYPRDWLAWYGYQDRLVHSGGYLGYELADTRQAQERLMSLRPDLVQGWGHLFWVAREQRDMPGMKRALEALRTLSYNSLSISQGGFDDLVYSEVQARALANDGLLTDQDLALAIQVNVSTEGPSGRLRLATNLLSEGLERAQLQLSDTVLALPGTGTDHAVAHFARSLALARGGRWLEALDAAGEYDARASVLDGARHGLRLAASAAVLGLVSAATVEPWAIRLKQLDGNLSPGVEAEIAWLLGLGAWAAGDREGVLDQRRRLQRLRGAVPDRGAHDLDRSLEALQKAAAGDSTAAAYDLVGILDERTRDWRMEGVASVPFFNCVVRLLAARWLLTEAPPAARRLLTWHETIRPDTETQWMSIRADRVAEPMAHALRAVLERGAGRVERAGWHQARVDETYGRADPAVRSVLGTLGDAGPPAADSRDAGAAPTGG